MDTAASNRRLRTILTAIRSGVLVARPDFQRRLVWNNKDKNLFIQTVLEGLPFPEVYIAAGVVDSKSGEGSELLVDGQQRLTTLYQYFTGSAELRLSKELKRYEDLAEEEKLAFLDYKVVVRDLGGLPIDEIKQVFERINSTSYGLNAMELNNSRYEGAFKQLAQWFAEQEMIETLGIFSINDVRRMNDLRYCLGVLASILGPYFNRDKEIEPFLSKYNEEVPDEARLKSAISNTLEFIAEMDFSSNSRVTKKSDFFTLFVELHRALNEKGLQLKSAAVREALDKFYLEVDEGGMSAESDAASYYQASLQASNDRSSRILRGHIIGKMLETLSSNTPSQNHIIS